MSRAITASPRAGHGIQGASPGGGVGNPCRAGAEIIPAAVTNGRRDQRRRVTLVPSASRLRFRRVTIDEALVLVQETVHIRERHAPGYPDDGTRFFALRTLESGSADEDVFAMYHVIERSTGALVGHIGFKGGPDGEQAVRIGYALASGARRRGFAQEALAWILALAAAHPEVRTVKADTTPENVASQRVLERGGLILVRREPEALFYEISV